MSPKKETPIPMRYLLEMSGQQFEDVGAERVEFGPTHIAFYDGADLVYAVLATRILTVTPDGK